MPSSRGSSRPRDWTCVSYVSCRQVLLPWAPPGKPLCSSKLKQNELGQVRPRRLCGREDGSPGPVGQPGCWRGACLFYRRVRGERWKPEATGGLRSQTWEKVDRASCRDDKERHKQRLGWQSGSQGGRRNGTGSQVQAKWRLTGGELNLPGLDTQLGLSFTSTRPDNICIMSTCWLDKAKPPPPHQRQTGGIHGGGGGEGQGGSMCIHQESHPVAGGISCSTSRSHPPPEGTCRKGILRTGAIRIFFGTIQVTIVCCLESMKLGRSNQYQFKKKERTKHVYGPWANCLHHKITELFYSWKNWSSLVSAPWQLFDHGPRTQGAHSHLGILISSCAVSISIIGYKVPKCILRSGKTSMVVYISLIVPFTWHYN